MNHIIIYKNSGDIIHSTYIKPDTYDVADEGDAIIIDITDPNNPLEYVMGDWHPVDKD